MSPLYNMPQRILTRNRYEDEEIQEEEGQRPAWMIPDTPEEIAFLATIKCKWFKKAAQKRKAKAILRALALGDSLGENIYTEVITQLANKTSTLGVPMPRSWYDWISKRAGEGGWSIPGFIGALENRDDLIKHCQYMLKKEAKHDGNSRQSGTTDRAQDDEEYLKQIRRLG